jgi:hypothetical protein
VLLSCLLVLLSGSVASGAIAYIGRTRANRFYSTFCFSSHFLLYANAKRVLLFWVFVFFIWFLGFLCFLFGFWGFCVFYLVFGVFVFFIWFLGFLCFLFGFCVFYVFGIYSAVGSGMALLSLLVFSI